ANNQATERTERLTSSEAGAGLFFADRSNIQLHPPQPWRCSYYRFYIIRSRKILVSDFGALLVLGVLGIGENLNGQLRMGGGFGFGKQGFPPRLQDFLRL